MGKIPMQEKSAQQGQKNNPINCSGFWLVQKNPRLNFAGASYYSRYVGVYHHWSTAPISQP